MLVLSRKPTESLVITVDSRDVEVQVVRISGGRVTLGVSAPAEIPVTRPAARDADAIAPDQPR